MALVPVIDGTTADGADVQQVIDVLSGTGAHPVQFTALNDAANPALTVRNQNTAGVAMLVKNPAGNDRFRIGVETASDTGASIDVFRVMEGGRVIHATDNAAMQTVNRLTYDFHDSGDTTVMWQLNYENNSGGATPDVATAGILGIQRTGNAYFRTVEIDHIAVTGTSTWPHIGLEMSINANHLGNNSDRTVGISVMNFGSAWGLTAPKQIDTAFLAVGRLSGGFVNYFRALDTDVNAGVVLFNVNQFGIVESKGGFWPTAASAADLGGSGTQFRVVYVDTVALTALGAQATPALKFNADPDTGIFQAAASANTLSVTTGGTEQIRITAGGLLDWRNGAVNIALGGGAAPTLGTIGGTGPGTAGQAGWLKMQLAGANLFVPYWV